MRKYLGAAVIAAIAALLTAVPALASSNAVLSDTNPNPNGTNTAPGSVIAGSLSSTNAQFTTTSGGSTGVFCTTSTTSATVGPNPGDNPTAPGTANLSLTAQTFSSCTSNISGVRSINKVTVDHLPYNVSITSPPPDTVTISPGSSGNIHVTVNVTTIFFQTLNCGYHVHASSGNITGSAGNGTNTISFSNQQFDGDNGNNFQCTTTAFFTASYSQVDSSNGNAPVFAN